MTSMWSTRHDIRARHDLGRSSLVRSSYNAQVTYGLAGVNISGPIIDATGGSAGTLRECPSGERYRSGSIERA